MNHFMQIAVATTLYVATGLSARTDDVVQTAGHRKLDTKYKHNPLLVASRTRLNLRPTVVEAQKP